MHRTPRCVQKVILVILLTFYPRYLVAFSDFKGAMIYLRSTSRKVSGSRRAGQGHQYNLPTKLRHVARTLQSIPPWRIPLDASRQFLCNWPLLPRSPNAMEGCLSNRLPDSTIEDTGLLRLLLKVARMRWLNGSSV